MYNYTCVRRNITFNNNTVRKMNDLSPSEIAAAEILCSLSLPTKSTTDLLITPKTYFNPYVIGANAFGMDLEWKNNMIQEWDTIDNYIFDVYK